MYIPRNAERGAILLTALVMLLVLTMLGLSAMGSKILEERMATNSQENHRSLRAAESALEVLVADADSPAFRLTNTRAAPYTQGLSGASLSAYGDYLNLLRYIAFFRQSTGPRRGSGWDTTYAFYHFDIQSEAETKTAASSIIHAGVYQVGRK